MGRYFFYNRNMNKGKIIKAVLFVLAGIAILVLHSRIMPYAGYVVGGVVIVYALEDFILSIISKKIVNAESPFFEDVVQVLIGILLIISSKEIEKVCVIWGIWSIIRESKELTEAIVKVAKKRPGTINAIESVVVIVMSVLMIISPSEHHAHVHIILLGIELILEIVFEFTDVIYDKYLAKKSFKKALKTAELNVAATESEEPNDEDTL